MHSFGPPTDLIEYEKLLRAIANYRYPDPVDLPGLPGVVGKRRLDPGTKLWLNTAPLTEEDQACLRELVRKHTDALPPLQTVMGRKESLKFRRAFRKLKERPNWEPVLRSTDDRWLLRSLRGDVYLRHDSALKKMIAEGTVRHFDGDRIRTRPHFERVTYLIREEAQTYLKQVGLDLPLLMTASIQVPAAAITSAAPHDAHITTSADARPALKGEKPKRRAWSPEHRLSIIQAARSTQLEAIAAELDISLQYAKQLASRFERRTADEYLRARATASFVQPPSGEASPQASLTACSTNAPETPMPLFTDGARVTKLRRPPPAVSAPFAHDAALQALERLPSPQKVLLRMPEVEQQVGLKRSSIYDRLNPKSKYYDPSFPRPVSLGGNSTPLKEKQGTGGAIGFRQDEIEKWIATRLQR